MGFKSGKTHHRDEISGLHVHDDAALKNGEVSVNQLRSLMDSRQAGINDAAKADWTAGSTLDHPAYGNALSRLSKPSDAVVGSKAEHYGSADENEADAARGGAAQKPAKQKGIEPARKRS